MKIDSSIKPAGSTSLGDPARSRGAGKAAAGAAASSAAAVHLSSASAELQAADANPSVDSARVAEIKQAISEGRFTINVEAIADSLINTAKELVSSQRQA